MHCDEEAADEMESRAIAAEKRVAELAFAEAIAHDLRRTIQELREEKGFTLDEYEARALKRLLENTGCAQRWSIKHIDGYHLCDGDWGHQIYAKILRLVKP
jgi:hypothetical protein